jgi:acetyl-CoA carboxylase alpha subunit
MCYRDMTFCGFKDCAQFGPCARTLTGEVRVKSEKMGLPICQFVDRPDCFADKTTEDDGQSE